MQRKITYFESIKENNTPETFRLVKEYLDESCIKKIVLASTTGSCADYAMKLFENTDIQLVVVPHQFDFSSPDNRFPKELTTKLRERGHFVHFGTMLFHTDKLFGTSIPNVIANFLRCFSQGFKVCYEIVLMATDAGILQSGEKVIAIAGTGLGADTALVMQASSTQHLERLRVNEIICKPLYEFTQQNQ